MDRSLPKLQKDRNEPATAVKTEETFQLSDRVNRISVSPTMVVLQAADQLKSKGVDVADFGAGEPDFPTPEHIKRAAIQALDENRTKYTPTPGIAALREAICEWHTRELGSSYQPAECVVNVGGKHSIFNAVCCLINSGDEVVIPAPYWVSYPDIVKYAGGKPVILETRADDNFVLRAAESGKGDHAAHAHGDRGFAKQSFRRRDSSGRIRESSRGLPAPRRLAARRRVLFAFHLRRCEAIFDLQRAGLEKQPSSSSVRFRKLLR